MRSWICAADGVNVTWRLCLSELSKSTSEYCGRQCGCLIAVLAGERLVKMPRRKVAGGFARLMREYRRSFDA